MSQIIIPLVTALSVFMSEPLTCPPKQDNYLRSRLLSLQAGIVAYRGGSLEAPENSLPAFSQAIKLGVQGVHLDVRKTKDNTLVLAAEDNLYRVTGQHLLLSQTNLADLPPLQKNIKSQFGETFYSQTNQQKSSEEVFIPTFEEICDLLVESDVFIVVQDHTTDLEDTKQLLKLVQKKGLLSRLVLQTEKSRWSKLRSQSKLPLNLMEPTSGLQEKFEQFVAGELQEQTETPETDLLNTTFNFKTLKLSPESVRLAPLSEQTKKVDFNWSSSEVTVQKFAETMEEYKQHVQLMNMTYQQKVRLPVAYFPVNYVEDLKLAKEVRANLVFTERPAELLVEKLMEKEQLNFQR